jgi:PHD/YefM family antitoxin component YafN of YafNO toxin-antitoxin module
MFAMKVITVQKLQEDLEAILDDVSDNKAIYKIQTENGDLILMPYDHYEVMADAYKEWVDEPKSSLKEEFDPYPLPVMYVDDAEPKPL